MNKEDKEIIIDKLCRFMEVLRYLMVVMLCVILAMLWVILAMLCVILLPIHTIIWLFNKKGFDEFGIFAVYRHIGERIRGDTLV